MQGVGAVTAPAEFQVPPAQLPGPAAHAGRGAGVWQIHLIYISPRGWRGSLGKSYELEQAFHHIFEGLF